MSLSFTARAAGVDDGDCLAAGLAETVDGGGRSLTFQASLYPADEQEVSLGMDAYCLTTESHATAYGCLDEVVYDAGQLRLVIRPEALDELGLDDPLIVVQVAADPESVNTFREMLREILAYGRPEVRPRMLGL